MEKTVKTYRDEVAAFRIQRLNDLIEQKFDGTDARLAEVLGISPSYVSRMRYPLNKAGRKGITENRVKQIEELAGVPGWFDETSGKPNVEPGPDIRGLVPLISWVQAGKWTGIGNIKNLDEAEFYPCIASHGPNTYALRVKGKSMYNPTGKRSYDEDDIIFVDPDRSPENGNRVVARFTGKEETTFKQLVIEGDKKYLMALNPDWPEKFISINGNIVICGVVIGKWVDE